MAHSEEGIKKALFAGVAANAAVGAAKFTAFMFTGSAAMLAESIHSLADSTNQLLLFLGINRSKKPANHLHPFGYSVERYFWSFIVAMNIFTLGAVVAIYEGIKKIQHPHDMENVHWNYLALLLAAIFEAFALSIAWKEFKHWKVEGVSLWKQFREAKDLTLPTVLFEDAAALVGILMAALGIWLSQLTGDGRFDGLASLLIGVLLLCVAIFLARESHSLLIGESAPKEELEIIHATILSHNCVEFLKSCVTLYRGPGSYLLFLVVDFKNEIIVGDLEIAISEIESQLHSKLPNISEIYIEAGTSGPNKIA